MADPASPGGALRAATALLPLLALHGVLLAVAALAMPFFFLQVLDRVLATGSEATLAWLAAALAVALLAQALIEALRMRAMHLAGQRLAARLRPLAFDAVAAAAPGHGAQAMQPLRDVGLLRSFAASPAACAGLDLIWVPPLLAVLALLHPAYALVAAACVVVLLLLNLAADGGTRRALVAAEDAAAHAVGEMTLALRAAEPVLAMGMLPALRRRWQAAQAAMLRDAAAATSRTRTIGVLLRVLRLAMTGAMVATGVLLVLAGQATPGSMIAANLVLARLLLPFEQIGATWRGWIEALSAWRRIGTACAAAAGPARERMALPCRAGVLCVERLVYLPAGAERPVLRGISFTLNPGEVLAIVGGSGAGKSTLLRLLLGIEAPSAGTVQLDGYATHLWQRADLARHVGFLPQHLGLVEATIAETIARLDPRPDMAAVIAAARAAGLHGAIGRLPHGYATRFSPAGAMLSDGQRQRLALARALYGAPRIVVLDEPNAHLDAEGEAVLARAIAGVRRRGGSVVLVAHRRGIIDGADRLMVLQDGLVVRQGERGRVLSELAGPAIVQVPVGTSAPAPRAVPA